MGLKSNLHNLKEKYKGKKMAPAFNAIHTFLYLPNETTHNGTHIKAADDLKRTMNTVIMAMVPCLIFGMFNARGKKFWIFVANSMSCNWRRNYHALAYGLDKKGKDQTIVVFDFGVELSLL